MGGKCRYEMRNHSHSEQSTSAKGLIQKNKNLPEVHQGVFSVGLNWPQRQILEELNLWYDPI
jgi:hypothetical protein